MINTEILDRYQQRASDEALRLVEKEARRILAENPNLDEFVIGMGRWFFTYRVGITVRSPDDYEDILIDDNNDIVCRGDAIFDVFDTLDTFIGKYDDLLHVTGGTMRFTATGPKKTTW